MKGRFSFLRERIRREMCWNMEEVYLLVWEFGRKYFLFEEMFFFFESKEKSKELCFVYYSYEERRDLWGFMVNNFEYYKVLVVGE